MKRILLVLLVVTMMLANLDLKVLWFAEIIGRDVSLNGFGAIIEDEGGKTIATLHDGERLVVTAPSRVITFVESIWNTRPVKPKPHVQINLKRLLALRPEQMGLAAALVHSGTTRRRIVLNWPPVSSPWHLPTGLPMLAGLLREGGHEVIQRYSHITALEHGLRKYGGPDVDWALERVRDARSDITILYRARMVLEEASRTIPGEGDFAILRNNVHFVSTDRDGTIEGVLRAVDNRERQIFYDFFRGEVASIVGLDPEACGISIADERQLSSGCVLASMIKDALPGTLMVLGGNFWSQVSGAFSRPEFRRFFEFCDAIVWREGFRPLQELAETLQPAMASGTVWFDGSDVRVNPATTPPIDFQTLPTPIYAEEPKPWLPEPAYPLFTMSHCPFACGFCGICAGSDTVGQKPRAMTPARIAEHMLRSGRRTFDIADETFLIERQLALGEELKRIGCEARWRCFVNADEQFLDPEVCHRLYQAGCRLAEIGLESLSPKTLAGSHKPYNKPEQYGQILRNLREAGILTHVFLLVGVPGEPIYEGLRWLDFLKEHGRDILTLKAGRYRLVRMSRDGRFGTHSDQIEVLPDERPLHPNLDFRYKSGTPITRKRVEALRDLLEQASREHWAYEVTSTVHWADRIRFGWNEFETMAQSLPPSEPVPHLDFALGKIRSALRDELHLEINLGSFEEAVAFSRSLHT